MDFTETELNRLVESLGRLTESAGRSDVAADQLAEILGFISKVVHVVDQAFQDVFVILIRVSHLEKADLKGGSLSKITQELDLITARSKYRDAEEICSRLYHLRKYFQDTIKPMTNSLSDPQAWQELLWVLEDREGRIIVLVENAVRELRSLVGTANAGNLPKIRKQASEKVEQIRKSLSELRNISNEILGLSGQAGLLELISDPNARKNQIFVNRGAIHMSRDVYSAGQVGAMGPGASAQHNTFQQIWNQKAKELDLRTLSSELQVLRDAMRRDASSTEHDIAIGRVAAAEADAKNGNGPGALEHLKAAGKWAFDTATKIGVGVATAALKTALGV